MTLFKYMSLLLTVYVCIGIVPPSFAQEVEKEWSGNLGNGQEINIADLVSITEQHKQWLMTEGEKGVRINLQKTNLMGANLQKAVLYRANLQEANLFWAKLKGVELFRANLQKADLRFANLQEADLRDANLQGADVGGANFMGVLFEIKPESLPGVVAMASAHNLSQLKYQNTPHALVELRTSFKDSGFRKQEREITYAIKRSSFENHWERFKQGIERSWLDAFIWFGEGDYGPFIEVCLGRVLFESTCKWGMAPERPLGYLIIFIGLFSIPYTLAIKARKKNDGIWKVWIPERVRTDLGRKQPELLRLSGKHAMKAAIYFSVLSAFNIGWRDLNVGGWIARIQPREYRLQATGWVRSISGIQSLISVYLLALSFLTYFGRPFESY